MLEIIFIGLSLSADAFVVTISNALAYAGDKKLGFAPFYFGALQGIMPIIGFSCASILPRTYFSNVLVCVLLSIIGIKMILEGAFAKKVDAKGKISHKTLFFEAIATSIDALAVGVSLSIMKVPILLCSLSFAVITFIMCKTALNLCRKIKDTDRFEIIGGVILIAIGFKQLLF